MIAELRHLRAPARRGEALDRVHPPGRHAPADDDQPVRHPHLGRQHPGPAQPDAGVGDRGGALSTTRSTASATTWWSRCRPSRSAWGSPAQDVVDLPGEEGGRRPRRRPPPSSSFDVGQVYRVLKHNDSLVLFRQMQEPSRRAAGVYIPPTTEALVLDMTRSDQAAAGRQGSRCPPCCRCPTTATGAAWAPTGAAFWFDQATNFAMTERGLAFYVTEWRYENNRESIDQQAGLPRRAQPRRARGQRGGAARHRTSGAAFGVVADPVAPARLLHQPPQARWAR